MARELAPVIVKDAFNIPDAWFRALTGAFEYGDEFEISSGSYAGQRRLQIDYYLANIVKPWEDMFSFIPEGMKIPAPTNREYVENQYLSYLMTGEKNEKEDYTYGQRLNGGGEIKFNQIETVIERFKKGHKTNQCCMEVGMPSDIVLGDPPCLRVIDTKIIDNALNFFVYFRSWDLWGGLPGNLCGIEMLKQYMASEIGAENGGMIIQSAGLHLYDHCYEIAAIRIGKDISDLVNKNPRILERTRKQFSDYKDIIKRIEEKYKA